MRYFLFSVLLLGMLLVESCTISQRQTLKYDNLEYDSISVPIDFPYIGFYYTSSLYCKNDTVFFAGYNHFVHSIDIFDVTNRKSILSLSLDNEGPDAVLKNMISSFVFNDSLVVFKDFSNELKFYSIKRQMVFNKIHLFPSDEKYSANYMGIIPGQFKNNFSMRLCNDMILLPVFSKEKQKMGDIIAASVEIENFTIRRLDITYPDEMKEDLHKYGSLTYPCLSMSPDRIVYNFPYSSHVYSYMLNDGKTNMLSLDSEMTKNKSTPKPGIRTKDARRHLDYENMSLRFGETYYDKETDSYIRVHYDEKDDPFGKEESYLMVYNCETKQCVEYKLPNFFSTRYYVNNGFVLFLLNNNDDSSLYFASVDIRMLFECDDNVG